MTLLNNLTQWQKDQARREGIDGYMVLPFSALKAIAQEIPQDEAALLAIKGIGPVKVRKYGKDILTMVAGGDSPLTPGHKTHHDLLAQRTSFVHTRDSELQSVFDEAHEINTMLDDKVAAFVEDDASAALSTVEASKESVQDNIDTTTGEVIEQKTVEALGVSDFLTQLNQVLGSYFNPVRVRGEIIGFKRNQNGHAYFELKDDNGIMRVSIFKNAYDVSGVMLADGMEIIVTGKPQHHARYGFSFIGEFVELAGEGALKKAYDALKAKLMAEGLMADGRKRALPELPTRIGLITSPTGAAIGDFTTNVGKYGYHIVFHASTVEGPKAVTELKAAIARLAQENLDVLVITRGGGSLESLAAFNNENIVRALADFPVPVIAGIGHEQDETLATLVADVGVSTPTAAARAVRSSWDDAITQFDQYERVLLIGCETSLQEASRRIDGAAESIHQFFDTFARRCENVYVQLQQAVELIEASIRHAHDRIGFYHKIITSGNPLRALAQGYSIARSSNGQVIRSTKDVASQDAIHVQVCDGDIDAVIK